MYIILIAWGFVVVLMAAAEAISTTIFSGLLTFTFYGVLPMAILLYLMQTPDRRKRRAREEDASGLKIASDPPERHAASDAPGPTESDK